MAIIPKNQPISISQVASALGAASNDLGTLCTHENINMWAKWKPVSFKSLGELTLEQQRSVSFGLFVPDSGIVNALSVSKAGEIADITTNEWEYSLKPTGGENSPYRLSDFRGYNHDAQPPIEVQFPSEGRSVNPDAQRYLNIWITVDPDRDFNSEYDIQGYDLLNGDLNLKEYKWVWVVRNPDTKEYTIGSASENILDSDGEVQSDVISIDISSFTQYVDPYEIYIGMAKWNGSDWAIMPVPNGGSSQMNKMPLKLSVIKDTISGGAGVADPLNSVFFSYDYNGVFRSADECTDEGSNSYVMGSSRGDISVKVELSNGAASATTISRSQFEMSVPERGTIVKPDMLYTVSGSTTTYANSITIPAKSGNTNGKVTCILTFRGVLSYITSTNINNNVELDIYRLNTGAKVNIWNGVLNYRKASSDGWSTK